MLISVILGIVALCPFVQLNQYYAHGLLTVGGESFVNTDFWFMPNDYNISDVQIEIATFATSPRCTLNNSIVNNQLQTRTGTNNKPNWNPHLLLIGWKEAKAAGCNYYQDLISQILESPAIYVTIFGSTATNEDIGRWGTEPYGDLWDYQNDGLALTLINKPSYTQLIALLENNPDLNASITADPGNWVRFGQSAGYRAYYSVFIVTFGSLFILDLYLIVKRFIDHEKNMIVNSMIILGLFFTGFRVTEFSVDPMFLKHIIPYWLGELFWWSAHVPGYAVLTIMGIQWTRLMKDLVIKTRMKKISVYAMHFSYYSIFHFTIIAILQVVKAAYANNESLNIAASIFYYTFVPGLLFQIIIYLVFGTNIIRILRSTKVDLRGSKRAQLNVAVLILVVTFGFLYFIIDFFAMDFIDLNLGPYMALISTRDLDSALMFIGVGIILYLQTPSVSHHSTDPKNGTNGSTGGSTHVTNEHDMGQTRMSPQHSREFLQEKKEDAVHDVEIA